jgi:hypothetical protein
MIPGITISRDIRVALISLVTVWFVVSFQASSLGQTISDATISGLNKAECLINKSLCEVISPDIIPPASLSVSDFPLNPTTTLPVTSSRVPVPFSASGSTGDVTGVTAADPLYITKYISIVGPAGPAGKDGRDGKDGVNGANGSNGLSTQASFGGYVNPTTSYIPATPTNFSQQLVGVSTIGYLNNTTIDVPIINGGTANGLKLVNPIFTGGLTTGALTTTSASLGDATTTNLYVTGNARLSYLTGAVQCLHIDAAGNISGTGSDCNGNNAGTFTAGSITATSSLASNGTLTVLGTSTLATTTLSQASISNALITDASVTNLSSVNSSSTNSTTTNLVATNASSTNGFFANLLGTAATFTGLSVTNSTILLPAAISRQHHL